MTEKILRNKFHDPMISSDSEDEQQNINWDEVFSKKEDVIISLNYYLYYRKTIKEKETIYNIYFFLSFPEITVYLYHVCRSLCNILNYQHSLHINTSNVSKCYVRKTLIFYLKSFCKDLLKMTTRCLRYYIIFDQSY